MYQIFSHKAANGKTSDLKERKPISNIKYHPNKVSNPAPNKKFIGIIDKKMQSL